MNIAVISDIHLGRGDRADRALGHDEALLRFLDQLEAQHELIILLGDIWETLTSRWPGLHKREARLVKRAHPELAQRFDQPQYHYIVGNHDRAVGLIEGSPHELVLEVDQLKIRFTHGHQHDIWSTRLRYIGEAVVWISGWGARLGTDALTRFFDWFHNVITGTSDLENLGTLELELIEESKARDVNLTVIGHTHLPGISRDEDHLLVNSGYCLGSVLHFVSIDTQEGRVEVYRTETTQSDLSSDLSTPWEVSLIDSSTIRKN